MGPGHDHSHSAASRSLGTAFLLNAGFTAAEIVGGLLTNSVAILSDAVHDAGDSLSLGIAWLLQRVSERESDTNFTYGYRRFSVLGALITGLLLLVGLGFVLARAIPRLSSHEEVHGPGMLAMAILGILVNGAAALRLRSGSSLNERIASWHLLEDVLGWAAVLLGSIAILLWDLWIIDPILSIGISLFVLWNVVKNLKKVFAVFLQRVPEGFDAEAFVRAVQALPNVVGVHHTHVWTLDGEHHVLTTHVVMNPAASRNDVEEVKGRIRDLLPTDGFEHVTIDIEFEGDQCASIG